MPRKEVTFSLENKTPTQSSSQLHQTG